jgi:hypothetical protein
MDLSSWIVADDPMEMSLLRMAWPHETALVSVDSTDALLESHHQLFSEDRTLALNRLVRRDYALAKSPVFGDVIVLRLPRTGDTVFHEGGGRRSEAAPGTRPRFIMNSEHPFIILLEKFAVGVDRSEQERLMDLLDLLCEKVIEPRTKRKPEVAWIHLRGRIEDLLNADLSDVSFLSLRPDLRK